MRMYENVLEAINKILASYTSLNLAFPNKNWKETSQNDLVFKSDSAYELGSGTLPGISSVILTDNNSYVSKDEIILIGNDLSNIKEDMPYARIAIIKVNDDKLGTGNKLYSNIRKIDYSRYHIYPDGFMMLISAMSEKESVRISKKAVKNKISFSDVGMFFINEYKKNPAVEAAKLIFITDPKFDYDELLKQFNKAEDITKALDHLLNKVKMDCHSCSLQKICEEVEKLCEEDFKDN